MHLTEGLIRTYLDNEMAAPQKEQVRSHLASCPQCQQLAEQVAGQARQLHAHLSMIDDPHLQSLRPHTAHARLQVQIAEKEKITMRQKIFSARYRPVWVAIGLVLILATALAFPPVRAIANSFLGLFRVQQFTVVQVNPGDLPEQLGSSTQLEQMFTDNVVVDERGEPQDAASRDEASQLAGIPVRLPTRWDSQPALKVTPGGEITFNVDLQLTRALLEEIGRSDIQLPDELDGATVQVSVASGVTALYGDCEFDPGQARQEGFDPDEPSMPRLPDCTTFMQMPSPTITAPPGLDIPKIGEAYLQLMGMSPEEAASFAQTVDWSTTLVIPIPRYGTTYREVPIDGVNGTLIIQEPEERPGQYLLVWVKDGMLYSITGPGDGSSALRLANSLE
jgi:hypothetical protein